MMDGQTLALVAIAALNTMTAVFAYLTHRLAKRVEVQTNSMKDALVAATKKAAFSAGREDMREEKKAEAKVEAKAQKGDA